MLYLYGIFLMLAVFSGWFILYRIPLLQPIAKSSIKMKTVSIIIPARNEEKNLPKLLESIQNQTSKPLEVLVVDDHSDDNTVLVAKEFGVKVIELSKNEMSWVGKSAGCYAGAKAADGDWLLFLDADTFLPQKDSLARIMETFGKQNGTGILSIQPFHWMLKPYENLSAVFNILVLAGMNRFSFLNDKLEPGGAFGPSMLVNKMEYFAMGGHKSVQASIMENVALGQLFLKEGLDVHLFGGKDVLHFRMYPEGVASVGQGWSKSFASGSTSTHPIILIATSFWITGAFISFLWLIISLASGNNIYLIVGTLGYLAYALQFYRMVREIGNFKWVAALAYPLLFIYFVGVYLLSAIRTFFIGSVSWKGRKMDV